MKKRKFYDWNMNELGEETFKVVGQFADGHLCYEVVDNESEGSFVQVRHDGKLVMIRL